MARINHDQTVMVYFDLNRAPTPNPHRYVEKSKENYQFMDASGGKNLQVCFHLLTEYTGVRPELVRIISPGRWEWVIIFGAENLLHWLQFDR